MKGGSNKILTNTSHIYATCRPIKVSRDSENRLKSSIHFENLKEANLNTGCNRDPIEDASSIKDALDKEKRDDFDLIGLFGSTSSSKMLLGKSSRDTSDDVPALVRETEEAMHYMRAQLDRFSKLDRGKALKALFFMRSCLEYIYESDPILSRTEDSFQGRDFKGS